ncbi:hypothetical protein EVA_13836 [gut metagenome]|uniref:Uncharacterized protein n=1 Tax=gut metagenome TaxID=749906 RepID=J9FSZ9_9ZZZZ
MLTTLNCCVHIINRNELCIALHRELAQYTNSDNVAVNTILANPFIKLLLI